MKFLLLLSFLLALMPGQNVHRLHIDRTPDFVALTDLIQAIPNGEKANKKSEVQNEDFFLPPTIAPVKLAKCTAASAPPIQIIGQTFTVPYSIRGPPTTV